jgi:hypothetical protein
VPLRDGVEMGGLGKATKHKTYKNHAGGADTVSQESASFAQLWR